MGDIGAPGDQHFSIGKQGGGESIAGHLHGTSADETGACNKAGDKQRRGKGIDTAEPEQPFN